MDVIYIYNSRQNRFTAEIKEMGCAWGKENSKQRILSTNKSKVKVKV